MAEKVQQLLLKPARDVQLYVDVRSIRFGETDAARIVYTVRFFDYAIDAIDGWFDAVVGITLFDLNMTYDISCPFVHAELDFLAPLRPGDELATEVLIERMGRSSLSFVVQGGVVGGHEAFVGRFTISFIAPSTMKSIPIPAQIAERVLCYQRGCPERAHASAPALGPAFSSEHESEL